MQAISFADFFLADILTSMSKVCIFFSPKRKEDVNSLACISLSKFHYFVYLYILWHSLVHPFQLNYSVSEVGLCIFLFSSTHFFSISRSRLVLSVTPSSISSLLAWKLYLEAVNVSSFFLFVLSIWYCYLAIFHDDTINRSSIVPYSKLHRLTSDLSSY